MEEDYKEREAMISDVISERFCLDPPVAIEMIGRHAHLLFSSLLLGSDGVYYSKQSSVSILAPSS